MLKFHRQEFTFAREEVKLGYMKKTVLSFAVMTVMSFFMATGAHADTFGHRRNNTFISTGDARADVRISNVAGLNFLRLGRFGSGATDVNVFRNGAFSDNRVSVRNRNNLDIRQTNNTRINNDVDINQNTGFIR